MPAQRMPIVLFWCLAAWSRIEERAYCCLPCTLLLHEEFCQSLLSRHLEVLHSVGRHVTQAVTGRQLRSPFMAVAEATAQSFADAPFCWSSVHFSANQAHRACMTWLSAPCQWEPDYKAPRPLVCFSPVRSLQACCAGTLHVALHIISLAPLDKLSLVWRARYLGEFWLKARAPRDVLFAGLGLECESRMHCAAGAASCLPGHG